MIDLPAKSRAWLLFCRAKADKNEQDASPGVVDEQPGPLAVATAGACAQHSDYLAHRHPAHLNLAPIEPEVCGGV